MGKPKGRHQIEQGLADMAETAPVEAVQQQLFDDDVDTISNQYSIELTDSCRVLIRIDEDPLGRMRSFALMQQAKVVDEWVETRRVDTSHGTIHEHVTGASEETTLWTIDNAHQMPTLYDMAYVHVFETWDAYVEEVS